MLKSYLKGTHILFCTNYSRISINVYCTLKIEEILNVIILPILAFCNYLILKGDILNISKTIFLQLILHRRIRYQLYDVDLKEFYIHSAYA